MGTIATIQARMSSTRLPGKVMLPLDGVPVLQRLVQRLESAETLDEVVVATTDNSQDDVVDWAAAEEGATVFRGDEGDVLGRLHGAATVADAEQVVRICGDSPFVSGRLVDSCVRTLEDGGHDYVSNKIERTFPLGFDVEVFTMESFDVVEERSTESHEREHVTVYYRENPEQFSRANVRSDELFDRPDLEGRTDIRVTLDEAVDYRLIDTVYRGIEDVEEPSLEDVIRYIDDEDIAGVNREVDQKSMYDAEET